jgi:hypothetical protein
VRWLTSSILLASCLGAQASGQTLDPRAVGVWGSEDSTGSDGLLLAANGTFRQVTLMTGREPSYSSGTWSTEGHRMCMVWKKPQSLSFCWPYVVTPEHALVQGDAVYFYLAKKDRRVHLLEHGGS